MTMFDNLNLHAHTHTHIYIYIYVIYTYTRAFLKVRSSLRRVPWKKDKSNSTLGSTLGRPIGPPILNGACAVQSNANHHDALNPNPGTLNPAPHKTPMPHALKLTLRAPCSSS